MGKHLVSVFLCVLASASHAIEQTYIREYTYRASEHDSLASAREQTLAGMKRELLGELGTHIFSRMEIVQSNQAHTQAQEKIYATTQGMVKAVIEDEKWNGYELYLKAKLTADPDEIARKVAQNSDHLLTNIQVNQQLASSKLAIEELKKELAYLKSKMNNTPQKDEAKSNDIKSAYNSTNKKLTAYEYLEQANQYYLGSNGKQKDVQIAKDLYVKAAKLGNKDAWFFIDYLHQIDVLSQSEFSEVDLYRQSSVQESVQTQTNQPSKVGWGEWGE